MKRLIVLVAGLNSAPKEWYPLANRLRREALLEGSDFLIFDHCGCWNLQALRKCFTESIETLAIDLKAKIERCVIASPEPYDDIICIAHSVGGLIVRQAYLLAAGAYAGTPKSQIPWTDKVSRFVLIASINRGFEPNRLWASGLVGLSSVTGIFPMLREMTKGAAFVTSLRISWIRHFSNPKYQKVIMIQLLGTQDSIVKREDSIDLQQFPNGVQFDVPDASHDDLYRPSGKGTHASAEWDARYQLLQWAILQYNPKQTASIPSFLSKKISISPVKRSTQTATVFIVHGIRGSNSGWPKQLEQKMSQHFGKDFVAIRSTYGYFSAFNFFFPWLRRRNIRWFQDQYSYHFALNPQAEFYFIGHSNGTYLLGESLKRVAAMRFKRVYLAGSVLPCDYQWQERFDLSQVEELRNDRSCWDWPVGILCSGLRGLGMRDIGTGGFDGFQFDDNRTEEVCYFQGSHGKPLADENQNSILSFIAEGDRTHPPNLLEINQISSRFRWCSRLAPYLTPLLVVLVIALLLFGGWCVLHTCPVYSLQFWLRFVLLGACLYVAYAIADTA